MKPSEVLRISWEAILKNKVRSLLTMLGIIIGVAAVIIMVGISAGTSATIEESITSLGSNLVYVNQSFSMGGVQGMRGQGGGGVSQPSSPGAGGGLGHCGVLPFLVWVSRI